MLRLAAPSGGPVSSHDQEPGPLFDTLVLGREHGLRIAGLLGDDVGSVLVDPEAFTCTFFLPSGAAPSGSTRRRRLGNTFPKPRKKTPPGPFWLTAPDGDRPVLTPARQLRAALVTALSPTDAWLARTASDPAQTAQAWAFSRLADLRAGIAWDALEMPLGLATMAKGRLESSGEFAGPLLAAGVHDLAWWLIPTGHAAAFASLPTDLRILSTGHVLSAPQPRRYAGDRTWLIPPREPKAKRAVPLTGAPALHTAVTRALPSWRARQRHP